MVTIFYQHHKMPLVSSVVLPHGAMVFDGGEGCTAAAAERLRNLPESLRDDCHTLFKTSCEAAEMVKATKPDVIFLNTPHGLCLSNAHCVYLNSKAKGSAEWNNQWMEYNVSVDLDSQLAQAFVEHLQKEGVPVEGMNAFGACEVPLRWGEVIPLWFFRDLTACGVKVVIFSNPLKRKQPLMLCDVAEIGSSVGKFFNSLEQRVLYVVSGDLAHSHETSCTLPLYLADPRWNMPKSKTALPFDLCIEHWIRCTSYSLTKETGPVKTKEKHFVTWDSASCKNAEQWLSRAMDLKQTALSCGIYGFGILHGVLMAEVKGKTNFDAHLLCRLAPTYYGMAVAAFISK